ncbi:MAG TPA: protein kinase [Phycisphaerales bacterium]|nr:protein kinase [Phycisphaerales bacterium]HMP36913.1 protein kinase [Phycisphaerales bacterium]
MAGDQTHAERHQRGGDESPRQIRFRRAESLFRLARELDEARREAWLLEECPDDEPLRAEVLAMVRADAQKDGLLDVPVLGGAVELARRAFAERSRDSGHGRRLPARIGRFDIVGVIGHGGMGVVYEARQDEPSRAVALKVMHAGRATGRSLRRFRREAQTLGRLQHPGIAQIFEAGVDDWGEGGQPYFAMELVRGPELLTFAHERSLGVRERLALLARVCDAVHHAHQHGVIHRDLKPANILVVDESSGDDGSGTTHSKDGIAAQPKILDFGVARLLDSDTAPITVQTSAGQILGTVPYMSPEQAEGDPGAIDIRTDVYALGVVAYELLAGRLPHDLKGKPLHEALRVLREHEPTRLGALDRRLGGDIETIVAKALSKDRHHRFASAAEMAADFRRVLRHEPIRARRLGVADQIRKFSRRHRALVGAAMVVAAMLVAATAVSARFGLLARRAAVEQRRLQEIATERAEAAERSAYRATLAAASMALRSHDMAEAMQRLDSVDTAQRGWEWAHLRSRGDQSVLVAPLIHPSAAAIVTSADGTEFILATANGVVERRRAADLGPIAESLLPGDFRARWITSARRSATGDSYWISTRAAVLELDATTLEPRFVQPSTGPVHAIDPRGRHLLGLPKVGRSWFEPLLVRVSDATIVARGERVDEDGFAADFSPEGALAAWATHGGGGLVVVATEDGAILLHRPDLHAVTRLRISDDGARLAAATSDGLVHLLSLPERGSDSAWGWPTDRPPSEPMVLRGHPAAVAVMDFSPDGSRIATATRDGCVRLWRTDDASLIGALHGHGGRPSVLAFTPDGSTILTCGAQDGSIRAWSAIDFTDPFLIRAPGTVYSIAFSPDGRRIATASLGGERPVRIWDRETLLEQAAFGAGTPSAIAFDRRGDRLAVGHSHGPTEILDAERGERLASWPGQHWRTDWVAFDEEADDLLAYGNHASLERHTIATGERTRRRGWAGSEHLNGCRAARAPDGSILAIATNDEIAVVDPRTFETLTSLHDGEEPLRGASAVAFSPDGRFLVAAGVDRRIRVWSLPDGALHRRLDGHTGPIFAIAFSPDGRRMASGGDDRVVRIWDGATFEQLTALAGHSGFIYSLAWSPDGTCLASGGGDGTMRLWDVRTLRDVLAARAARAARAGGTSAQAGR